jgi:hypothetical protein
MEPERLAMAWGRVTSIKLVVKAATGDHVVTDVSMFVQVGRFSVGAVLQESL